MAAEKDDLPVSTIAFAGALGVLIVVAAILGVQVLYYSQDRAETERKVYSEEPLATENILAAQRVKLNGYRVIDREKGTYAIPIERAMELVVRERSARPAEKRKEVSHDGR